MDQLIRFSTEPVDPGDAHQWLAGDGDVGAVVVFTGHVRHEAGKVSGLVLEHYPDMAEAQTARILEQAAERWQPARIWVQHRTGTLGAGDLIVLVGVASQHRQAAFEAAAFVMDFLKTQVPIWKKTVTDDGETWVSARHRDAMAAARWQAGED